MLQHMFKFMWNRKKRNFLLMIEIFFSFIVLLVIASMAISGLTQYLKPTGYSYQNVWALRCGWSAVAERFSEEEIEPFRAQIEQELRSHNEILDFSWTSYNFPYSRAMIMTSFKWQGQDVSVDYLSVDDNYASVLNIPVIEGRWFDQTDDAMDHQPIIINRRLKEKYFGSESVVNKMITTEDSTEYFVVGMIDDLRYKGELETREANIGFFRKKSTDVILFSVRPGTGVAFEEKITKRLSTLFKDWNPRIEIMQDMHSDYIRGYMTGVITMSIVAGFLIFNVALGLFGVLWNSISRRRNEIGLRRAMGAHSGHISKQILGESLVLATFAIIIGTFLAIQAPLFGLTGSVGNTSFVFAIACAALMIYLIVSLCSLYPSWLAARIQPAEALHYE